MSNNYKFKINKITTNSGFSFTPKRFNILIGANNCGKTQTLREIHDIIAGYRTPGLILQNIDANWTNSFEEFYDTYLKNRDSIGNGRIIKTTPTTLNFARDGINVEDLKIYLKSESKIIPPNAKFLMAPALESLIVTDNRLLLLNQLHLTEDHWTIPFYELIEALYFAGPEPLEKINEHMFKLFKKRMFLSPYNPGFLEIHLLDNDDDANMPSNPQAAYRKLDNYPLLNHQGDGLRSIAGIISALVVDKKPVILIDEPEMSLPPSQAYQFGKIIHELILPEQQLFVSTHSSDFLRGIMDGNHKDDSQIIHISRTDNQNNFKMIDSGFISEISNNPLLSSSHILEGLFYKGVVGTEGDSDERFYNAVFQRIGLSDDVFFVRTNNKQTLKSIFKLYEAAGIKLAVITDIDILRNNAKNAQQSVFAQLLNAALNHEPNKQLISQELISDAEKIVDSFRENPNELLQSRINKLEKLIQEMSDHQSLSEKQAFNELAKLRHNILKILNQDPLTKFKQKGREALNPQAQKLFDQIAKKCQSIGIFIVPVGELESWLHHQDQGSGVNKAHWIEQTLPFIRDADQALPESLNTFMQQLRNYLAN